MAQEDNVLRPHVCVIGGGPGGLAAAAAAAAMGASVVLIEKGRMGGQSLTGALPTKALLASAERVNALRAAAQFGVKAARPAVDFTALKAQFRHVVDAVAPQDAAERFAGLGVRVIAAAGRFADPYRVTAGGVTIAARDFIIATGSAPIIPAIPGLKDTPYLTPQSAFDLADCPRHLIVIGAGRIGLEMAQAFRRLGAEVTVLEAAIPLKREDRECAQIVLDSLAREGVKLRTGAQIAQVRRTLARIQVVLAKPDGAAGDEEVIEGSHLLIAAGRRPNHDGLDLEAAGIRHGPQGIVVDSHLRTTNKRVYAIGDAIAGPKFAHAANHHAGLVVRNALFRQAVALDHRAIARATYTDPELAHIGLLEDEARAHAGAIRILRWPYRENDRAVTTGATTGHIKVITDRAGAILGATIVGAQASENIAVWALAIGQRLPIGALAGLVVPYPTYAEVGKRAAITYFMRGLTPAPLRRIMGWLRRPG
jgi:pyruvate/2-oxoglutarate dehydrogenase complex dihydrolipoamide dehydrogenase (E3) component